MGWLRAVPQSVVEKSEALPGRAEAMRVAPQNIVTGKSMEPPFPEGTERIVVALGCFWGAEKSMWGLDGVWTTAVGYAGGWTENPTYEEVCTGRTGHTESVLVVYDPSVLSTEELLAAFWESHDPTTRNQQGNDVGTQYRSAVYASSPEQLAVVEQMREMYQQALDSAGRGAITTEIGELADVRGGHFYYAEDYHQQYLAKNPNGYDCHARTGVACPLPR